MIFKTEKFGKDSVQRNETLFTLGNGNIGMRGDTEEKAGTFHKGTYINGFFDKESILYGENAYGYAKNHETILNLPDAKRIELCIDGKAFAIDGCCGFILVPFNVVDERFKVGLKLLGECSDDFFTTLKTKAVFNFAFDFCHL